MEGLHSDPEHDVRTSEATKAAAEDERFMRIALEQAWTGQRTLGGGEVGCVIVQGGKIIASAFNEAEMLHDPTAHSEIVALRRAGAALKKIDLCECTIYCTLQCCTMCTAACIWAKVRRIVYGATRNDVNSMYFDARDLNTSDLVADAYRNDIEVVGGVLAEECSKLYVGPEK